MSDQQFQGVTAPMSLKSPTEADLAEDKRLVDALTSLEAFPTADDNRKRILALIALEDEAIDWIKDIATENVSFALFRGFLRSFLWWEACERRCGVCDCHLK